jgi:hypothetical protein
MWQRFADDQGSYVRIMLTLRLWIVIGLWRNAA